VNCRKIVLKGCLFKKYNYNAVEALTSIADAKKNTKYKKIILLLDWVEYRMLI